MERAKLIIVLGPTAVGKSDVAIRIALAFRGEIVNADSQQVYRFLNIGTDKPSREQRQMIPHHLIDVVDPDEDFDAARFRSLAIDAIEAIRGRGHVPLVAGGTGLYIRALTGGLFPGPPRDPERRARLQAEIASGGVTRLYRRLEQVDPKATAWIHPHDSQRIVRALEVYELTGKPISEWQSKHGFGEARFDALKIGLNRDRAELYRRIDERCERMIEEGLVEEVRDLVARGYGLNLRSMRSVGYRHVGMYLQGLVSLGEAIELMKRDTRRLAKRQLTWFRADREIRWFHPDRDFDAINAAVESFLTAPPKTSSGDHG